MRRIALGSYRCWIIAIFVLLTRLFPIIFHHRASVSPSETPNNIITFALLIKVSHCICLVSFITRFDCSFIIKSLMSSFFLNSSFLIWVSLSTPMMIDWPNIPWTWIRLRNVLLLSKPLVVAPLLRFNIFSRVFV